MNYGKRSDAASPGGVVVCGAALVCASVLQAGCGNTTGPPVEPPPGSEIAVSLSRALWYQIEQEWGARRRDFDPTLPESENVLVPTLDIDLGAPADRDVRAAYPHYDGFSDPGHERDSWRCYRIELAGGLPLSERGPLPDLSDLRHVRVWFQDPAAVVQSHAEPGRRRVQIAGLTFERADWCGNDGTVNR